MALNHSFWSFSDDGREFSFTKRDLDQPWKNFISTDHLNLIMTQTGSGMSYGRSPGNDRLTAEDNPRMVYLRDRKRRRIWSANGTIGKQPADWCCTHGFGYTSVSGTENGIHGEVTWFLPLDEPVEIWRIQLTNTTRRRRELSVVPFTKWCLGFAGHEEGFDNVFMKNNVILAECHHWPFPNYRTSYPEYNRSWDRTAFMTGSRKASGYDCVLPVFLGKHGSFAAPAAVKNGTLTNSSKKGAPSCAALQYDITLAPGRSTEIVVLVGMSESGQDIRRIVTKYGTPPKARKALKAVTRWWDEYLSRQTVTTPDTDVNRFVNGWNRYGMYIRYYHRFGIRDTGQDMAAFLSVDRDRVDRRIKRMFESQYTDGYCHHDVQTLGFDNHVSINSDVPLWLPWTIGKYIRETGDLKVLKRKYDYVDGGKGDVYEHCKRSIDWILQESGRHGLPLLKCGDWNDCLMGSNRKGVSVWLALFLHINLMEMYEIATRTKRKADARRFKKEADRIARAINTKCWDGNWYVRAFDDDGKPIGTRKEREGRIFMNPQTWAILSGVAPEDRALKSMKSVERLMDTPVGIPMLAPPYTKIQQRIGLLSRMAPGYHHNGGSWNHAVTWAILAECQLGRADRALDLYRKLFPPYLSQQFGLHVSEPYAYTSYTNTPASDETGRTGVGWNTGTVCWIYRTLYEGFAGVRPGWDGLEIDPSLPSDWPFMELVRDYRGNRFHIRIENPSGKGRGIAEMTVDGRGVSGNVIKAKRGATERSVRVILG